MTRVAKEQFKNLDTSHSTRSPLFLWFQISWSPLFHDLVSATNFVILKEIKRFIKKSKTCKKNSKKSIYFILFFILISQILSGTTYVSRNTGRAILLPVLTTWAYITANIFESGPMPTPIFRQLASHPKFLVGSKLSLG